MAKVFILQSQQASWNLQSLIEADNSGNKRTLILNNSSGGSVSLTGLELPGAGRNDALDILNRGTSPILLLASNAEALTANQFADGATIGADGKVTLLYNGLRWEVLLDTSVVPLDSPAFTGTPTAPTAAPGTTTTQLATTAFVTTSPALAGAPTAPTATPGTNTTQLATTAFVEAAVPNSSYRALLTSSGSHIAGQVAGTYSIPSGQPLILTGAGSLNPPNLIYLLSSWFPTVDGKATKLLLQLGIHTNATAPTGSYNLGLYPVTRPGSAGGAGLNIFDLGAVVSGSQPGAISAPAAGSSYQVQSADFVLPASGYYVLGLLTTGTVAASAHIHVTATLFMRNN